MSKNNIELRFLGTKGEIEEEAPKHKYHSSLLISYRGKKILIDYGTLQKYSLQKIKPDAVFITHAHPDHYVWTVEDCKTKIPIYLTQITYDYGKFKPKNYHIIKPNTIYNVSGVKIMPYKVLHSLRCPAIGYKIKIGKITFVYNPDLVDIVKKVDILKNVDYYIGDSSCIRANLVRRRGNQFFGHTRVTTQINWCKKAGIKNIIFTHFGKETIKKEKEFLVQNKNIIFAHDGKKMFLERIGDEK